MRWIYLLAWFPMLLIAVANGAIRDLGYRPFVGELAAHQLSTLAGVIAFGFYIRFVVRRWRPASDGDAWRIGLLWLVMTVCFEFGFGRLVIGQPWGHLLRDYNLFEGRVWSVLLVWVLIAPSFFARLDRGRAAR